MTNIIFVYLSLHIFVAFFTAYASDPSMLQDFCIGTKDPKDTMYVNGLWCKNPSEVRAEDFVFRGLNASKYNNEGLGLSETLLTPINFPGLNTIGITVARDEYASNGLVPPHIHQRASEAITVLDGSLYPGFVTGANKLYSKIINPGDVFVFPQGLIHFISNIGKTNASAILVFSSQSPGGGYVGDGIFGSHPPISVDVISKAFQLDTKIVEDLQSKF